MISQENIIERIDIVYPDTRTVEITKRKYCYVLLTTEFFIYRACLLNRQCNWYTLFQSPEDIAAAEANKIYVKNYFKRDMVLKRDAVTYVGKYFDNDSGAWNIEID